GRTGRGRGAASSRRPGPGRGSTRPASAGRPTRRGHCGRVPRSAPPARAAAPRTRCRSGAACTRAWRPRSGAGTGAILLLRPAPVGGLSGGTGLWPVWPSTGQRPVPPDNDPPDTAGRGTPPARPPREVKRLPSLQRQRYFYRLAVTQHVHRERVADEVVAAD